MRETIYNDIVTAMKNKDAEKLSVLRMLKGAIQLEEINKKDVLNDDEVVTIISKQIKTRKESIEQFKLGNRSDLVEKTEKEIDILNVYLPKQLTVEEVATIIDKIFEDIKPTSIKDMGKIMGAVMPLVKGKTDMALVNKIIKEKLEKI